MKSKKTIWIIMFVAVCFLPILACSNHKNIREEKTVVAFIDDITVTSIPAGTYEGVMEAITTLTIRPKADSKPEKWVLRGAYKGRIVSGKKYIIKVVTWTDTELRSGREGDNLDSITECQ